MPTVYGYPNCVGWYVAERGVWADAAASTPAVHGSPVARWDDQSGAGNHLLQPSAADRPAYTAPASAAAAVPVAPFGTPIHTSATSFARAVSFDGATSLALPATLTVAAAGCTAVMCTRGAYYAPLSLGTGPATLAYGWMGGTPQRMGVYTPAAGVVPFPAPTFLPALTPVVHGLRCSAARAQTRLYVGTNQTADLPANYGNAARAGGSVGHAAGVAAAGYGSFGFVGDIFELVIYRSPLIDAQVSGLLAAVQTANRLRTDANRAQVVFVGDDLTVGTLGPVNRCYPWHLTQQYGGSFKPLVIATPGHTVGQQQALVTQQVLPLDRSPFASSVAVVCAGGVDLADGTPAADVAAAAVALCASLRLAGFQVVVATVPPRAGVPTIAAFNDAVRGAWPTCADALCDWAADGRLSDAAYLLDGVHTSDAGDGVKAERVRAALDPLLAPPPATAAPLTYGAFHAPGGTFAGRYGRFPRV